MQITKTTQTRNSHETYRPLPDNLTIKPSTIHGLGVFATENIEKDTRLGITHVYNRSFPQNWIRTPLGGFYNHSDTPNCHTADSYLGEDFVSTKVLVATRDIVKGEELTCTYSLYNLKETSSSE